MTKRKTSLRKWEARWLALTLLACGNRTFSHSRKGFGGYQWSGSDLLGHMLDWPRAPKEDSAMAAFIQQVCPEALTREELKIAAAALRDAARRLRDEA